MPTGTDIVDYARTQVQYCEWELGSNDGQYVKNYLASVNVVAPNPWCMAFVVYCHLAVGINNIPKTGLVSKFRAAVGQQATPENINLLQPGDIVMRVGQGLDHAGIFTGIKDGKLMYISGNTSVPNRSKITTVYGEIDLTTLDGEKKYSFIDEHSLTGFNFIARCWS